VEKRVIKSNFNRVEMFGIIKSKEKTVSDIVGSCVTNNKTDEDIWGVKLNEYESLIDEEDVFDQAPDDGPSPAIEEFCEKPKIYTTVEFADGGSIDVLNAAYNQIRPGYTIILYGPRRSGKSTFIRNICQRIRPWYPNVIVFTTTKDSGEYFGFIPIDRVVDGLDEDLLMKLILNQRMLKRRESRGEDLGNYELLIIIDDCMSEKLRYKDIFNKVFFNGRHYNITLIVTVQDVKGVAPAATINADLAYSFALPDRRGRDTIREKFVDYLDRNQFANLMDCPDINKKYHILCFDIAHRYNPINNRISFGCCDKKAEVPFVMGDYEMWKGSEKQLMELGFEYLLSLPDWGIIQKKKKTKTSEDCNSKPKENKA